MSKHIYIHSILVNKDAIDINNHVSNIKYIQWMQDSAIAHANVLGFNSARYMELGITWIVASHQISYIRPILLNDEIEITTWVSKNVKSKFAREYVFKRKGSKKVLAKAQTVWICFDIKENKVFREVPDEILEAFKVIESSVI